MDGGIKRKVNLLGEPGVGKTSLILRFVKNVYGDEYLKTVGTNVYTKEVPYLGSDVKLILYDIMGESDFQSIKNIAFEESTGAIAVADITREETLYKLIDDWLPKYEKLAMDNAPVVLAVNKLDLQEPEITRDDVVDKVLSKNNVLSKFDTVFFTSAKTGKNVEDMFQELAYRTMFHRPSPVRDVEDMITMDKLIDEPKKLLSGLLAYGSQLGEMPYSTMEELLDQSGIDKFSLEEDISESQVLKFGEKLMGWYEDKDDVESSSSVSRLIEKYEEDSSQ